MKGPITQSEEERIKPCPFCGASVQLSTDNGNYGYTPPTVYIKCPSCKIGFTEATEEWKPGKGTYTILPLAKEKVITRWNTRALIERDQPQEYCEWRLIKQGAERGYY